MHRLSACLVLLLLAAAQPAIAAPQPPNIASTAAGLAWISAYRGKPEPAQVPAVIEALSRLNAFDNPENCGSYVGFLAGVLADNPATAETLIAESLKMRSADQWLVLRAIAYSGLPDWKPLLRQYAARVPARRAMIDKYIGGKLPTLAQVSIAPEPSAWQRFIGHFRLSKPGRKVRLEPSPDVLDTLWGYYFGTGSYGPILQLIAMLPWSNDRNDAARLTIGSMAKYTLARNASHDQALLAMLVSSSKAPNAPKDMVKILNEIIEAAQTVDTAAIREQALAAIEELKRKGPANKRAVSWWGYIGESTIAAGCLAAAVASYTAAGLPCIIGGSTASAAMNFWANQP